MILEAGDDTRGLSNAMLDKAHMRKSLVSGWSSSWLQHLKREKDGSGAGRERRRLPGGRLLLVWWSRLNGERSFGICSLEL